MQQTNFKVYGYRWIMLSAYMFIAAVNQLMWITFAPITSDATRYYGVSDLKIGILSMCFMIVYIVVSIPASWVIDKYGIRIGVGIGTVFTGVFRIVTWIGWYRLQYVALITNWDCHWSAIHSQCDYKNSRPLVHHRGAGHCVRSWDPGDVHWYFGRDSSYTLSYYWFWYKWNA